MGDPDRLRRRIQDVHGLPTLPEVLDRLRDRLGDPRTTALEVSDLIRRDPAIAAMVLRAANSPFYGSSSRVAGVTQAVAVLGLHAVQGIVLNAPSFDASTGDASKEGGVDLAAFWRHSLGAGLAARALGRTLGFTALEELFLAGLLHDTGTIVLACHGGEDFRGALRQARRGDSARAEAERAALGASHAEVGAWLLEAWRLPRGLADVARWHHEPARAESNGTPAALVHVADAFCEEIRFGSGGGGRLPAVDEAAWEILGVRRPQREGLRREMEQACRAETASREPALA
jgi:HD-like signal output (HDOD) protein